MNYTDKQLKQALAMMLPKKTYLGINTGDLIWSTGEPVRETELLHICWLVEETLNEMESADYADVVCDLSLGIVTKSRWFWLAVPWQQRVEALAKVKGIEI